MTQNGKFWNINHKNSRENRGMIGKTIENSTTCPLLPGIPNFEYCNYFLDFQDYKTHHSIHFQHPFFVYHPIDPLKLHFFLLLWNLYRQTHHLGISVTQLFLQKKNSGSIRFSIIRQSASLWIQMLKNLNKYLRLNV